MEQEGEMTAGYHISLPKMKNIKSIIISNAVKQTPHNHEQGK